MRGRSLIDVARERRAGQDGVMSVRFPEDPGAAEALAAFGLTPDALIGRGGEASVFAFDASRVLRVYRPGPEQSAIERRAGLLAELSARAGELPFALPRVLEVRRVGERWTSVETRLPGRPLAEALEQSDGAERDALVLSYLEGAARLCAIGWRGSAYGDLLADDAIQAASFREYLERRARRSLDAAGEPLSRVDAAALAAALPEAAQPAFVYLDYYPGNVLVDAGRVTAVVDFGGSVIAGEHRFGSAVPAAYLKARDQPLARAWLERKGLADVYEPARGWIAAFWSFARDDAALFEWCRSVLCA